MISRETKWVIALLVPYAIIAAIVVGLLAQTASATIAEWLPVPREPVAQVLVVAGMLTAAWYGEAACKAALRRIDRR